MRRLMILTAEENDCLSRLLWVMIRPKYHKVCTMRHYDDKVSFVYDCATAMDKAVCLHAIEMALGRTEEEWTLEALRDFKALMEAPEPSEWEPPKYSGDN